MGTEEKRNMLDLWTMLRLFVILTFTLINFAHGNGGRGQYARSLVLTNPHPLSVWQEYLKAQNSHMQRGSGTKSQKSGPNSYEVGSIWPKPVKETRNENIKSSLNPNTFKI